MNELNTLLGYTNLVKTKMKLELSNDEIETNHPHRYDLINSMKESIEDLNNSIIEWKILEKNLRALRYLNSDLTIHNLKLIEENKKIKEEIKEISVNIDYINELEKENKELKEKINLIIKEF